MTFRRPATLNKRTETNSSRHHRSTCCSHPSWDRSQGSQLCAWASWAFPVWYKCAAKSKNISARADCPLPKTFKWKTTRKFTLTSVAFLPDMCSSKISFILTRTSNILLSLCLSLQPDLERKKKVVDWIICTYSLFQGVVVLHAVCGWTCLCEGRCNTWCPRHSTIINKLGFTARHDLF